MNKDEAIDLLRGIEGEINTIIIGQEQMVRLLLVGLGLLFRGHLHSRLRPLGHRRVEALLPHRIEGDREHLETVCHLVVGLTIWAQQP